MKKILYFMMLGLSITLLASCEKDEEIGGTALQQMSGDWFVQVSDDPEQAPSGGYAHFTTYNTASNSTAEMWLDDTESYWQFKGKVNVDLSSFGFSADNVQNEYYDSQFTVLNGKILKDAATAPGSKAKTDSIYFQVKFSDSDNPDGDVYTFSGYKKTGFLEDNQ